MIYPHDPQPGYQWWTRPCYFSASYAWNFDYEEVSSTFSWSCSFCDYSSDNENTYGEIGWECPQCGAVFVGDDDFGTWQAKEMPDEWCEGREELWC